MRSDRYSRILVGVVALALAACTDDPTTPSGNFRATLNAASAVPATTSPATGTATCTNDGTASFNCTVNASNLTGAPTLMHIHAGASGVAGGIRVNICGTGGTAPACPATATFTAFVSGAQGVVSGQTFTGVSTAMFNAGTYLNIHTAANTGGEIRGQLLYQP